MLREIYAAATLDAALAGQQVEPLDPVYSTNRGPIDSGTDKSLIDETFGDGLDGHVFYSSGHAHFKNLGLASKPSTSPDILAEHQMRGPQWDEPKMKEVNALRHIPAFREVTADDPCIKGMPIVDTMFVGRLKRDSDNMIEKLKARCVLRGDLHSKFYDVSSNRSMSPVIRSSSIMLLEAISMLRDQEVYNGDVPNAYLRGEQRAEEQVVARPPKGFQTVDERGVEVLWLMVAPLYGQVDAGAIWNRTLDNHLTAGTDAGGCGRGGPHGGGLGDHT